MFSRFSKIGIAVLAVVLLGALVAYSTTSAKPATTSAAAVCKCDCGCAASGVCKCTENGKDCPCKCGCAKSGACDCAKKSAGCGTCCKDDGSQILGCCP